MKIKFAGFLRGLLRQSDQPEPARPIAAAAPAAPLNPAPFQKPAQQISPAPVPANVISNDSEIQIPLIPVVNHLPMDLKAKLIALAQPGQTISLKVEKIVGQLAFGSVKISFGELRALCPGNFASVASDLDSRQVSLPLQEILSRLNPSLLARRSAPIAEVAGEIAGPFDGRGRGITFTTQPLKPATAMPAADDLNNRNQPVSFKPAPTPPPAMLPRAAALTLKSDTEIIKIKPRPSAPPTPSIPFNPPTAPGNGNGHVNGNGNSNGSSNGNGQTVLPPFKFSAASAPVAAVPSSAPRPEPVLPPLLVSLDDLAEAWPENLRKEIIQSDLANVSVPLPMGLVDSGLKRGRVTMTWREIRTLTRPSSSASIHDGTPLELPLKVLAPAFFAAQKSSKTQKKLAVSEEIPNLFFGFPQATPAEFAPAPAPSRTQDTNFYVWGDDGEVPIADEQTLKRATAPATDFLSRNAHPRDVVARALTLPGVVGAVVALTDGLRVASHVPVELNADAVAAFLPQIFDRVNQSTRELRMGQLNNVSFTVGNVPWKIFRVNNLYFAAFGRPGESLPTAQLAGLATELDRKK